MREIKELSCDDANKLCDDLLTMSQDGRLSDVVMMQGYSVEESVMHLRLFANEPLMLEEKRKMSPLTLGLMAMYLLAALSQAPDASDAEVAAINDLAAGYGLINAGESLAAVDVSDAGVQVMALQHNEHIASRLTIDQFRELMRELEQLSRQYAERTPARTRDHAEFMAASQELCRDDKMARMTDVERAQLAKSMMVYGSCVDEGGLTVEGRDPDRVLNELLKRYNLLTHYECSVTDLVRSGLYSEDSLAAIRLKLEGSVEVAPVAHLLTRSPSATFAVASPVASTDADKAVGRSLTPS